MRSTLCLIALQCRICGIGMRAYPKHLKVLPESSSCGRVPSFVLLGLLKTAALQDGLS